MADKPNTKNKPITESGTFKLPEELQPKTRREPPKPTSLPEYVEEHGATTGINPIIPEGEDTSADLDDDPATGQ